MTMTNLERKPGQLGYAGYVIEEAIEVGNPFVKPSDPFVVLGTDRFSGSMFPVGSFKTIEEAMRYTQEKRAEEHLYSDEPSEVSTEFNSYTRNGLRVDSK